MNFIKKAITLVIAVSVIPIILAVISATSPNKTPQENYLEFEILDVLTNEVNISNNTIANKINDTNNIFSDLVVNANVVSNTLNTFILNDYQLVDTNGELPLGLPIDHLYFKFYDTGTTWLYAIDNDPYQIETGSSSVTPPAWVNGVSNDLTGYKWESMVGISFTSANTGSYSINFTSNSTNYTTFTIDNYKGSEYQINYNNTNVYDTDMGGWIYGEAYKTINISGGIDATNTTLINLLQSKGTITPNGPIIVPTYDTPQLVYDVTPLINAKIYSPTYETTLDQMDDNQIMGQLMEWYELSNFTIYQYTNNTDNILQMYNDGTISFNNTYNNGDIIRINYQADAPIIIVPMWYTLLMLTPLIFIAGILAYLLTERENQGV